MPIVAAEIVPLLIQASPSFEAVYAEYKADSIGEEWLPYLEMGEFARHVVDLFAEGHTADFSRIFATIELLIDDGDEQTLGLATVGILEDIQTNSSWHPFGAEVFKLWLGPKSRQASDELEDLWARAGGSLANVIRVDAAHPRSPAEALRLRQNGHKAGC